jgi:Flp pilus assembly protein TadD
LGRGLSRIAAMVATGLVVAIVVAAAHWPVLKAQALSLDDAEFVTENPLVSHPSWSSAGRFFDEVLHPSTVRGYYLPLSMISLMLDVAAGGKSDNLRAFHRTSLALHVANTLLIVLLLYRLFGAGLPAVLVGLLFGLHPLTVEPTAWIGERKTLLATFFALASLLAYVRSTRQTGVGWLLASLALFLPALLSKPTVTTLPLLMLVLDYWPLKRLSREAVVEKIPFFLLALIFGAITYVSQAHASGIVEATRSTYLQWPLKISYLLVFYLVKIVWPSPLSCVYPIPRSFALSSPLVLLSLLGVGALTVLLALMARRARGPLAGWAFFILALAPTLGLIQYSWVTASDKYLYLAGLGLLMILAWALTVVWAGDAGGVTRARILLLVPVLVILGLEAWGTRSTLRHWTDSLTLFRHMETVAPEAPVVQDQLGIILLESSPEEGVRHLRRAIELAPHYVDGQYNLGVVLGAQGRLDEGIRHLQEADRLRPGDPRTLRFLGTFLRQARRLPEAEAALRRAVQRNPSDAEVAVELGNTLVLGGRGAEAAEQFERAVTLAPADAEAHFRLAITMLGLPGRAAAGANHLREAIRLRSDWPDPVNALAWLLATSPDPALRDPAEALRLARRASDLTGGKRPEILDTVAAAEAAGGDFAAAERTARQAIELATAAGHAALAQDIQGRLAEYRRRVAYVEPAPTGGDR